MTDTYIETYSGQKFYFMNPDPDDISIEDIAHSLGMQVRYTGHAQHFYSIAEHSILVSRLCRNQNKLWGLLHDASEAYLTDVATPVKAQLTNYKQIERNLMDAICLKFGIHNVMPEDVHACDMTALRVEAKQLMHSGGRDWKINRENPTIPIIDWEFDLYSPSDAKDKFLETFYGLTT